MGNRLSKITTRTGDDGTTGLGDGSRISKADIRIQAIGDIDELNSNIGIMVSYLQDNYPIKTPSKHLFAPLYCKLMVVQHNLFDLGGEICIPTGYELLKQGLIEDIDGWIENDNSNLERLKEFILPGGSILSSYTHVARTVCRRAERSLIMLRDSLNEEEAKYERPISIHYLNRLSDWLFIIARCINKALGVEDSMWKR
jgi:cob(I)alamin adenosyltransferase